MHYALKKREARRLSRLSSYEIYNNNNPQGLY